MRGLRLGVAVFAGVLSVRRVARAEAPAVRVEYTAPEGCPTRERFIQEIGARTARLRMAEDGSSRAFQVTLREAGGRFEGRLSVVDPGGATPTERSVDGESCAVVGSALALVAALTIDPDASTAPLREPTPAAPPPPSPPPPKTPTAQTMTSTPEPTPAANAMPTPTPRASTFHLAGAFGVEALGFQGIVGTLFGPSGAAEIALDGPVVLLPSLRAAPELRIGASGFPSGTTDVAFGKAQFTWYRVELDACPLRLAFAPTIEARPCFVGVVGALTGVGTVNGVVDSKTKPWFELGALAQLDWTVAGPVGLQLDAGLAGAPLLNRFQFTKPPGPPAHVFQAPIAVPSARLAVRVRFP